MTTKVIAIAGMPGSGKGEVTITAQKLGFDVRSMGETVRKHFSTAYPGKGHVPIGQFADDERKKSGDDVWARRLAEEMLMKKTDTEAPVLIDGLRSLIEMEHFKSRFGRDFKVIAVCSSPATRYERLVSRHRSDDPVDLNFFRERDERELRWGLGNVIALADEVLVNEGTIEELMKNAETLLLKLLNGPGGPLE